MNDNISLNFSKKENISEKNFEHKIRAQIAVKLDRPLMTYNVEHKHCMLDN
jgi:hypothetical protein